MSKIDDNIRALRAFSEHLRDPDCEHLRDQWRVCTLCGDGAGFGLATHVERRRQIEFRSTGGVKKDRIPKTPYESNT